MQHETNIKKITITDVDLNFTTITKKKWFPVDLKNEIEKSNFLILPNEFMTEDSNVFFPETTTDFYDYIREKSNNDIVCDIAVTDENYQKLEKHSAIIEVATFIVGSVVLPIAINMVSSFLYELTTKYRRKPKDTSAKVKIISEKNNKKSSVMIEYEGPVEGIKEALEKAVEDIDGRD